MNEVKRSDLDKKIQKQSKLIWVLVAILVIMTTFIVLQTYFSQKQSKPTSVTPNIIKGAIETFDKKIETADYFVSFVSVGNARITFKKPLINGIVMLRTHNATPERHCRHVRPPPYTTHADIICTKNNQPANVPFYFIATSTQ